MTRFKAHFQQQTSFGEGEVGHNNEEWVLSIIKCGYFLAFKSVPGSFTVLPTYDQPSLVLQQKIVQLLAKGAIQEVPEYERDRGFF